MPKAKKQYRQKANELSGVQRGEGVWESFTAEMSDIERHKLREKPSKQRDQYMHLHEKRVWEFQECTGGKVESGIL